MNLHHPQILLNHSFLRQNLHYLNHQKAHYFNHFNFSLHQYLLSPHGLNAEYFHLKDFYQGLYQYNQYHQGHLDFLQVVLDLKLNQLESKNYSPK